MKKYVLLAVLLAAVAFISARAAIVAVPSSELQSELELSDLRTAVQALSLQGYDVLHYDREYVIAIQREDALKRYSSSRFLSDCPPAANLYLVGKLEGVDDRALSLAGRILLELQDASLLSSSLDEVALRALIRQPFTLLELVPMRFPDTQLRIQASEETRTSISQLISYVDTNSVQSMLQSLQDFQTRYALADNRLTVANWIRQQFINFGVGNAQLHPFTWNNTQQYNVVATITGTVYPDQYIIVGGHHDSVSNNSDPMLLAPGADDNASGTVAALEMARVIMQSGYQPKTSIRFITFAAEEFGLWGSKAYSAYAQANNMNIRLMMNHDMIAHCTADSTSWQVRLMPYDGSLDHSAYAAMITEQYTSLDTFYGSYNSGSSDSHPFWQRGYNVIYFFEAEFCPYYHSSNDVVANTNPSYCAEVIKASAAVAATFSDMPAAPANLQVIDTGNGSSMLATWEGYNDPSISHYNVYYSLTLGQWGNPHTTTQTSYMVTGLTEGLLYYFAVGSVDTFGNESYLVYSAGVPLSIPLIPQNFSDQPLYQSIYLSWTPNQELDLAGYRLYRSQSESELGDLVQAGLITDDFYQDNSVTGSPNYYYYRLCAVDQDGNASPYTQELKTRPISLDHGILIVDETANLGGATPFQPTDAQVDDFYDLITSHFSVSHLDLDELGTQLRLADIGIYSTLIWHGNDFSSMDYPYTVRDALQQYLEAGGNILFSIYVPSQAFELNATYPVDFTEQQFINSVIGIASANYDINARFRYAEPLYGSFPALEVDPLKTQSALNGHILRVEGIEPTDSCIGVYQFASDYENSTPQGSLNGACVAVLNLNHSGKLLTTSVPLYHIYESQAQQLIDHVLTTYFNEESSSADDPGAIPGAQLSISANSPNPFSGKTSFRVETRDNLNPLRIGIYNLRGQLVRTIHSGLAPKSFLYEWDGQDDQGRAAASGLYIVKASQKDAITTRKMMLIRQ